MKHDLILFPKWVVTVDAENRVLENHAVVVEDGAISKILPSEEAMKLASGATASPAFPLAPNPSPSRGEGNFHAAPPREGNLKTAQSFELVSLPGSALLPGFVNLHTHSAMALMRGLADDLPLMDWLQNHIWPVEGKLMSEAFVHEGTRFACAEMIRGGTTAFNDMYYYPAAIARAAIEMGMRCVSGAVVVDSPSAYAKNADEYLEQAVALAANLENEALVKIALAPHAPYTASAETYRKIASVAKERGLLVHTHLHETAGEVSDAVARFGKSPMMSLAETGVLNEALTAAHMVHLSDEEIALAAKTGISVAHNPRSNMKLGSGAAPVAKLLRAGVNVGIGTDGAASNNSLDMLADTRLAALLAKVNGEVTAVSAHEALRMATINGAKALGWDGQIGSLEAGKRADLIAIDLSGIEAQPVYDPVSQIVYATNREQVTHVWIDGECLMRDRKLTKVEVEAILENAEEWRKKIQRIKYEG